VGARIILGGGLRCPIVIAGEGTYMALNFMSAVGAFFAANEWLVSARFSQLAGYDYEARLHNRKAAVGCHHAGHRRG
jgi:hypothetical protein